MQRALAKPPSAGGSSERLPGGRPIWFRTQHAPQAPPGPSLRVRVGPGSEVPTDSELARAKLHERVRVAPANPHAPDWAPENSCHTPSLSRFGIYSIGHDLSLQGGARFVQLWKSPPLRRRRPAATSGHSPRYRTQPSFRSAKPTANVCVERLHTHTHTHAHTHAHAHAHEDHAHAHAHAHTHIHTHTHTHTHTGPRPSVARPNLGRAPSPFG